MSMVGRLLHTATARLRAASPTPRLDAELLLGHILGRSRTELIAMLPESVGIDQETRFWELIERRIDLEPVAYLTGEREFYGLRLAVDRRVLVPRPETELLVGAALEIARRWPDERPIRIADIGTGSGAIAIAMAVHLPRAQVWAVDISRDALEVARANVRRFGLEERVALLHGDGLAPLPDHVDLLLSNPPYTRLDEVDENVRRHEPHLALDGGPDGADVIRKLFTAAPRYIKSGAILMEIAAWQAPGTRDIAVGAFPHATITVRQDLAGLDRVLEVIL